MLQRLHLSGSSDRLHDEVRLAERPMVCLRVCWKVSTFRVLMPVFEKVEPADGCGSWLEQGRHWYMYGT